MKRKFTYGTIFIAVLVIVLGFNIAQKNPSTYELLDSNRSFKASQNIELIFLSSGQTEKPMLLCSGSYGKLLVQPRINGDTLSYLIHEAISHKIGMVSWKLLANSNSLSGHFFIEPDDKVKKLESYLGPPSIIAGGKDFAMLTTIPVDRYDNPLKDGTLLYMNQKFRDKEQMDSLSIKNSIAYHRIYSPAQTGRILGGTTLQELNSTEFVLDISPGLPSDYTITVDRVHDYADGNQICSFFTATLTDEFGNKVADGTLVNFVIENDKKEVLTTFGTTIDGKAKGQIIHPETAARWSVTSYITGIAKSNTISLNFKQALTDFEIRNGKSGALKVGPIKSFMNQLIPDGFKVTLYRMNAAGIWEQEIAYTRKGYASFDVTMKTENKHILDIEIEAGGIRKKYKLKNE